MLKSHHTSKKGVLMRDLINTTNNIASIRRSKDNELKKTNAEYKIPIDNSTQVLKSHLSRNRSIFKTKKQENLRKLLALVKQLICLAEPKSISKVIDKKYLVITYEVQIKQGHDINEKKQH